MSLEMNLPIKGNILRKYKLNNPRHTQFLGVANSRIERYPPFLRTLIISFREDFLSSKLRIPKVIVTESKLLSDIGIESADANMKTGGGVLPELILLLLNLATSSIFSAISAPTTSKPDL